jgi:hypothetical protein
VIGSLALTTRISVDEKQNILLHAAYRSLRPNSWSSRRASSRTRREVCAYLRMALWTRARPAAIPVSAVLVQVVHLISEDRTRMGGVRVGGGKRS